MSIKINKNGKEYPVGVIPQNVIDDVTFLKDTSVYSTTEKAVGTWIDGKTIYKKTIDIRNLPNATTKSVAHGITNLDNVIKIEGYARNGGIRLPLPYVAIPASEGVSIYANNTAVVITGGGDGSAYSGYVTLYYTKST